VRRRRSTPERPSRALDQRDRTRSDRDAATIDQRLDRVESLLREILQGNDLNAKRLNALQAQLDYLSSRFRTI